MAITKCNQLRGAKIYRPVKCPLFAEMAEMAPTPQIDRLLTVLLREGGQPDKPTLAQRFTMSTIRKDVRWLAFPLTRV